MCVRWTNHLPPPIVTNYMGPHTKSESDLPDPVTTVLDSFRRIIRALRIGSRAAEKQAGLSGAQLFVLDTLSKHPAQSLNELADRTRTHQSSVSVVVQRLVDRRLVSRHQSDADARRLELSISPLGRELLHDAPDLAQHRLIHALDRLPVADQTRLAKLLSQLVERMGEAETTPQMFFEDEPVPVRSQGVARRRSAAAKKI
jgi:DNA-binding MarR family transcriptional regulator